MNSIHHSHYSLEQQRQRLEALVQPHTQHNRFQSWGSALLAFLTAHNNGPRLRQRMRQGQLQWRAYDPVTQRTHWFATEQELRIWLESRYYE